MGVLDAFLHPIAVEEIKKVEISKRFVGEDGKPVPFEIKTANSEILCRVQAAVAEAFPGHFAVVQIDRV